VDRGLLTTSTDPNDQSAFDVTSSWHFTDMAAVDTVPLNNLYPEGSSRCKTTEAEVVLSHHQIQLHNEELHQILLV
jgi:hypothetical protein